MPRSTSDDVARQLRRAKALELHVKGKQTMRQIAKELEVSPFTVHGDIHKAVAEELKDLPDLVATHRKVETLKLDEREAKVLTALDAASDPDDIAKLAGVWLKISEQRSKLHGLYAPTKQEHKVSGFELDDLNDLKKSTGFAECPTPENEPES